jgi:hypothetical protein
MPRGFHQRSRGPTPLAPASRIRSRPGLADRHRKPSATAETLLEAGCTQLPARKAGTIMDPVYAVVKARSTTYCAVFLGQAQDMERWADLGGFRPPALFLTAGALKLQRDSSCFAMFSARNANVLAWLRSSFFRASSA